MQEIGSNTCNKLRPRSDGQSFFDKVGFSQKIYLCKFNSVAKFHCQTSATKMNELSNIRYLNLTKI